MNRKVCRFGCSLEPNASFRSHLSQSLCHGVRRLYQCDLQAFSLLPFCCKLPSWKCVKSSTKEARKYATPVHSRSPLLADRSVARHHGPLSLGSVRGLRPAGLESLRGPARCSKFGDVATREVPSAYLLRGLVRSVNAPLGDENNKQQTTKEKSILNKVL